jgi:hypothetical protein
LYAASSFGNENVNKTYNVYKYKTAFNDDRKIEKKG